jgi:CubicO group peptidase (beta-lactamase class C family)
MAGMTASIDQRALKARVGEVLNRWPVAGLAVGVIRDGTLAWFYGHGVADISSGMPVGPDTVFRIASVTKTITAVAVMQLVEQGLVDLDAPASRYLGAFQLIPARPGFRPATLRHLLTHTAGVRAVRKPSDLLRPALGWGVPTGQPVPPLADYYRDGLRIDTEPGTKWAYSNHGFGALGQIVEDAAGIPLGRYLREHVFGPLGMEHSDLRRSERVQPRLATGYQLGSRGLKAVTDREVVQAGAGAAYSTTRDMARYAAALLGGGANQHGRVLRPETLASMFQPHYQPDPRIPGMGLGFFRGHAGERQTVGHDGIWAGFHSTLLLVPGQGTGVVAFASTGPFSPLAAPGPVAHAVLHSLLDLPDDAVLTSVPEQPAAWSNLCGRYSLGPGMLTDPQPRMLGVIEVAVRRGHLVIRGQIPVPAIRQGLRLYPDGDDPYAFRIELPGFGSGTSQVVFSRGPAGEVTAMHLGVQPLSFRKRPGLQNPRPWAAGALAAGALAITMARRPRRERAGSD